MHEHHRERLKARFLRNGIDDFEPHNILELLLFYSVPRRDTNPIAHRLIDRFGSISAVFDADFNELVKVEGVGEHSASLIKLVPQLARRYMTELTSEKSQLDTVQKIGEYFVSKYIGETSETVYMLMLSSSYNVLGCELLHKGSVNSSYITMRAVIEHALAYNASMIVLAHNHPGGVTVPSSDDIRTTVIMSEALSVVDVRLIEHFIVAGGRYTPMMAGNSGKLGQAFENDAEFKRFYGDFFNTNILK